MGNSECLFLAFLATAPTHTPTMVYKWRRNEVAAGNSPNELTHYRISTSKGGDAQRHLNAASIKVWAKVRMSRDLEIFDNSEYAYANSPVELSLFTGNLMREVVYPKPLSMICQV